MTNLPFAYLSCQEEKMKKTVRIITSVFVAAMMTISAFAAENMVTNGDASSGTDGWGNWCQDHSGFEVTSGGSYDGSDCYHLYAKNADVGEHAAAWQVPETKSGKTYTVTACVKHKDLAKGAVVIEGGPTDLSTEHGDRAGSSVTDGFKDGELAGDSDWKVIWYTFTAAQDNVKIEMRIWEGYGDLWFDNFTVTEGTEPAYTKLPGTESGEEDTPAVNLATNGDASGNGTEGWGQWSDSEGGITVAEKAGPDGSDCFSLKSEKGGNTFVFQEFPNSTGKVMPGKRYTVTVCVKLIGAKNGMIMIQPIGSGYIVKNIDNGDSDWQVLTFTFDVPENVNPVKIGLALWDGGNGEILFDNFTVTEGSKPAYTEVPKSETGGEENPGGEEKPGEEKPGEEKPGEEKPGKDNPGTSDLAVYAVITVLAAACMIPVCGRKKQK